MLARQERHDAIARYIAPEIRHQVTEVGTTLFADDIRELDRVNTAQDFNYG